jgi:formylglycine-generating enzyme required for sulfatase activity
MSHVKSLCISILLIPALLGALPVQVQAQDKPAVQDIEQALRRFRELDAIRRRIKDDLKQAEVRAIRASIREGPRDEFETEDDYRRRMEANDRKRGEIAGNMYLKERDTLRPYEEQLAELAALRFKPETMQLALGPYDLENRRFGRVALAVSYNTTELKKGKKSKPAVVQKTLEAVATLALVPDEGRIFREHEQALQVEPMLCITQKGTIDFAREILVREPGSGITGRITNCHKAWHRSEATGMKLMYIPPGVFKMGSNSGDDDEKPIHEVAIVRGFFMGQTEVTQAQWKAIMGDNPGFFKGDDRPVENVTYEMAQEFVKRLNIKENTNTYRLPTEAEWEYAARAGKNTEWTFGSQEELLGTYAWQYENAGRQTHPVGRKLPNGWGLYDIHGNVWEWVSDWYAPDYYKQSDRSNPIGPVKGEYRVLRGGSWNGRASYARTANRFPNRPNVPDKEFGLRLVKMED